VTRWVLGGLGIAVGAYGGWLLTSRQDRDQLVDAGIWLVAGPPLHDFVLTALLLAALALGRRALPEPARAPATVGLIVFGTLTIAVLPVLGGFGGVPEESGVLARPYGRMWLVLAALVVVVVVAASLLRARLHRTREND
jgi:hypothetical protein